MNATTDGSAPRGGDRRRASKVRFAALRRHNYATTFSVGLVLALGATWYYLYANTASQTLAERDFRQLNQLAEHANGVLSNFPYLFQFSLLQEADLDLLEQSNQGGSCALAAQPGTRVGLFEYLRCQYRRSKELNSVDYGAGGFATATQDAADIAQAVRDRELQRLEKYFQGIRHNKILSNLKMDVLPDAAAQCTPSAEIATASEVDEVAFRLEGPPGKQVLAVLDCRRTGTGAADIRKRLVARIPFADLFSPASVDLDFDQVGVIDGDNNVLFLSTERIDRRNLRVGQMIDTSTFARIAKLDFEDGGEGGDTASTKKSRHTTTILERNLGNIRYKIFVQPHVPSLSPLGDAKSARWSIIGLKQTARFNVERFPLPAYQFGVFTFALILSVSLLPTIRLLFLGQGTSLSRLDFSILIFSLIIATGAAVVMGLMVDTYLKMSNDQRAQLEQVSKAINGQLTDELRRKYAALTEVEASIIQTYTPPPNVLSRLLDTHFEQTGVPADGLTRRFLDSVPRIDQLRKETTLNRDVIRALTLLATPRLLYNRLGELLVIDSSLAKELPAVMRLHDGANRERTPLKDIPLENYDPRCWNATRQVNPDSNDKLAALTPENFDLAWLMDGSGKQVGSQVSFRRADVRFISVPNREYFLRAASKRVWHPPWLGASKNSPGIFVERVFSRIGGNRLTIIAKPSEVSLDGSEPGSIYASSCAPRVAAIATHLDSLVNPVLPAGFGFAVINDIDGTVLYHSDDNLSLIQNFYTETTNNKSLLAATQFDEADHFTASYSGRQVQAFVAPIAAVPWSLVVFQNRELNASMAFSSALFAFGLVVVLAMIIFIAMESLHWRGYLISKAWWPHRTHTHLHIVVIIVSAAYLIGLVTSIHHVNLQLFVIASIAVGPYLFAACSLMWNRNSPKAVLALSLPPILLLWWTTMSAAGFVVLFCVFAGLVYLTLRHIRRRAALAEKFRMVHAIAGVTFLSAIVGAPAMLFYADALSFHLVQEQSVKNASFDNDLRRRRIAHGRYSGSLSVPPDTQATEPCIGIYASPTDRDTKHRQCGAPAKLVWVEPNALFASKIATRLAAWFDPISAETAVLRPRSGLDKDPATALPSPPVSRYVSREILALILVVTTLFLYVIARVASHRLFGLQGDASHYLEHWPRENNVSGMPSIEALRQAALLIGYSPSSAEVEHWRGRYIVASIEGAKDLEASGRTVILYGLEIALAETDAERGSTYRRDLERLQASAKHLVLCSEALPSYWLSHAVDDERAAVSGGISGRKKWLDLLGGFGWYAPPRAKAAAIAHPLWDIGESDRLRSSNDPRTLLRAELAAFPELESLFGQLEARISRLRKRQVLPVVFHAAHAIYARKWQACTLTEQALLLQLARKEIVNPEQYEVIGSLEIRGLIRRDPRIRMANQTFLWFVENASISEELADHTAKYQSNLWQTMRWPVLFVLALFALFLFQMGGEKVELAVGGLGSLLALITVARQLLLQLRGGTKS